MFRITPKRVGSFTQDAERARAGSRSAVAAGVSVLEGFAKREAPVDTGFLANSIRGDVQTNTVGVVRVGAEYGAYVNYGTRRAAPNPFFDRAVAEFRPLWPRIVSHHVLGGRL